MEKLGRNDPCRCGSGKKYKKCCLRADEEREASAAGKSRGTPRRSAAADAGSVSDPPSLEMLDDWMQEGYGMVEDGDAEAACDAWWKTWSALRTHHLRPAMTTMNAADVAFRGTLSIFDWCQDFQMELQNVALDETRFIAMGQQYAEEWLAQFSGETPTTERNFRQFHAELVARGGDAARALELFEQLPAKWPDDVWAHVYAGDAHAGLFLDELLPRSPQRALALYTRARDLATNRDDRDAVEDRISSLTDHPHAKPR